MATSEGKKKESSGGDAGTGSAAAESVSDKKNGDTSSNTATEANPKNAKYTPHPPPVANPAKFGKADPKRDILIFVGVMTVMFLISWELEDVGKPSTDPKKKSPLSQLKQMKKTLSKQFAEKLSINKIERWDCDLFVTKSSIPNVGLGIFAGKNYTKGDVIMDTGRIPIPLPNHHYYDSDVKESDMMYVDSYALLIKHHPTLYNIEGGDWFISPQGQQQEQGNPIIATRDIRAGEEFFLPYTSHPHSRTSSRKSNNNKENDRVFDNIPLLEDYNIADEIIQEQLQLFKATKQVLQSKRKQEIGYGLRSTQRAVARFNPKVASLLPTISNEMIEYRTGQDGSIPTTKLVGISNITHRGLALNAMCLDDVHQKRLPESSAVIHPIPLVAKRAIKNETVAFPVPLYVTQPGIGHESCSAATGEGGDGDKDGECMPANGGLSTSCMGGAETSLVFCPLLFGSIRTILFPEKDTDEKPNIELRWSERNFFNEKIKIQSIKTITTEFTTKLSWDAIALRDIEIGEEFVAAVKTLPSIGRAEVNDNLIPKKWRDRPQQSL